MWPHSQLRPAHSSIVARYQSQLDGHRIAMSFVTKCGHSIPSPSWGAIVHALVERGKKYLGATSVDVLPSQQRPLHVSPNPDKEGLG